MSAVTTIAWSKPTNTEDYYVLSAENFKPLGDRILVKWEHDLDEIRVGKVSLIRAELKKKMKYTGVVLKIGPKVDAEISIGDRILFDQFSNFEKFFDPELGRLALISESQQASAFAIIPARCKVGEGEGDFNYDKD